MPPDQPPTLSIVIPVYNEPEQIGATVADAVAAVERSGFREPELIVVDDGSDRITRAALQKLDVPMPLRVIHQRNLGRLLARRTGIRDARGDLVLLLDARVSLHRDGLRFVSRRLAEDRSLTIWNGHCEIDLRGNLYARFWNVLTELAYRDYLADPRTTSYGIEE